MLGPDHRLCFALCIRFSPESPWRKITYTWHRDSGAARPLFPLDPNMIPSALRILAIRLLDRSTGMVLAERVVVLPEHITHRLNYLVRRATDADTRQGALAKLTAMVERQEPREFDLRECCIGTCSY